MKNKIDYKVIEQIWILIKRIVRFFLVPILKIFHITWNECKWNDFWQFVKFSFVGLSNVMVSYSINVITLLVLKKVNMEHDYVIANIMAFVLSVLWSFIWNSKFVFNNDIEKGSKGRTLIKTYISYGFTGVVVNNVLATLWIQVFGVSKFLSPLLNLPISIPINYFMNKLWAYRVHSTPK